MGRRVCGGRGRIDFVGVEKMEKDWSDARGMEEGAWNRGIENIELIEENYRIIRYKNEK